MTDSALLGSSGEVYTRGMVEDAEARKAAEAMAAVMMGGPGTGPATVRMQPEPIDVKVEYSSDGRETFIGRQWKPGEAALCRLCPEDLCNASGDWCLVKAIGHISPRSCAFYSLRLPPRQDAPRLRVDAVRY